jgi:hypothetical protein
LRYCAKFFENRTAAALLPGGMDALFERAVGFFPDLSPTVLSRDPWVLQFDDFVSPAEATALRTLGFAAGFEPSTAGLTMVGGELKGLPHASRTSATAWCLPESCEADPAVQAVSARIANVSRVPYNNAEYLQILKYDVGQFYREHVDFIPEQSAIPCGPRLFTFFLYLNDVEEGGHTNFTRLGFSVAPKAGRAVLWPSVRNDNILEADHRTEHEAMPVLKGQKLAANAWLHLYDFKSPHNVGCANPTRNGR